MLHLGNETNVYDRKGKVYVTPNGDTFYLRTTYLKGPTGSITRSYIEAFRYQGEGEWLANFVPIDYVSMGLPNTAIFDYVSVSNDTTNFYFVETTTNQMYKFKTNFTGLGYLLDYQSFQLNQAVPIYYFEAAYGD